MKIQTYFLCSLTLSTLISNILRKFLNILKHFGLGEKKISTEICQSPYIYDLHEAGMTTSSSILAWSIPMDRGIWWATVHGVAESQTQLSD